MPQLKKGTQVIYVPSHAKGNTEHKDCEYGFVTSVSDDGLYAFCRYFYRDNVFSGLRTTANSERTSVENLVQKDYAKQKHINAILEKL